MVSCQCDFDEHVIVLISKSRYLVHNEEALLSTPGYLLQSNQHNFFQVPAVHPTPCYMSRACTILTRNIQFVALGEVSRRKRPRYDSKAVHTKLPGIPSIPRQSVISIPVFVTTRFLVKEVVLTELVLCWSKIVDTYIHHIAHPLYEQLPLSLFPA